MRCLNGGWSYSWQGDRCDEFAGDYNTIYEALRNKFDHVDYVPGVEYAPPRYDNWQEECVTGIDKAVSAGGRSRCDYCLYRRKFLLRNAW